MEDKRLYDTTSTPDWIDNPPEMDPVYDSMVMGIIIACIGMIILWAMRAPFFLYILGVLLSFGLFLAMIRKEFVVRPYRWKLVDGGILVKKRLHREDLIRWDDFDYMTIISVEKSFGTPRFHAACLDARGKTRTSWFTQLNGETIASEYEKATGKSLTIYRGK